MENNNEILQELKELSPVLRQLKNKVPFTVSSSYFNSLPEVIFSKIKTTEEVSVHFTKKNAYSVPHGYFAGLTATIMKRIPGETGGSEVFVEMEEIAPLLNTISKNPVYSVPPEYHQKAVWSKNEEPGRKVYMPIMRTGRRIFRYAAAAVIIGLLTIALYLFSGKQISDKRIVNVHAPSSVKTLSEQEIMEFLKTTSSSDNIVSNNNNSNQKDTDVKSIVNQMSEKEIQRFLEEYGEQDEM